MELVAHHLFHRLKERKGDIVQSHAQVMFRNMGEHTAAWQMNYLLKLILLIHDHPLLGVAPVVKL